MGFPGDWDMEFERKGGIKHAARTFGPRSWKNGTATIDIGKIQKEWPCGGRHKSLFKRHIKSEMTARHSRGDGNMLLNI